MSQLNILEEHLQGYWQLDHHRQPALATCLKEVQAWQRQRMERTHLALFTQPNHHKIAAYFLDRLYGGDEFETLARQLERIIPRAKKIERVVPDTAIETGSCGIHLAVLAVALDEAVAKYLMEHQLDITEDNMAATYRALNQEAARKEQMALLSKLCYRIDKYVRSYMLKKAFDFSKSTAYKHHFHALYDFLAEGFDAMKPIKSMEKFVEPFCENEIKLIDNVHLCVADPFRIEAAVQAPDDKPTT